MFKAKLFALISIILGFVNIYILWLGIAPWRPCSIAATRYGFYPFLYDLYQKIFVAPLVGDSCGMLLGMKVVYLIIPIDLSILNLITLLLAYSSYKKLSIR